MHGVEIIIDIELNEGFCEYCKSDKLVVPLGKDGCGICGPCLSIHCYEPEVQQQMNKISLRDKQNISIN